MSFAAKPAEKRFVVLRREDMVGGEGCGPELPTFVLAANHVNSFSRAFHRQDMVFCAVHQQERARTNLRGYQRIVDFLRAVH